eukprot:1949249-Rhodomonas_salina.1
MRICYAICYAFFCAKCCTSCYAYLLRVSAMLSCMQCTALAAMRSCYATCYAYPLRYLLGVSATCAVRCPRTDPAYAATSVGGEGRAEPADAAYAATDELPTSYTMSGTDLADGSRPRSMLCDVRY